MNEQISEEERRLERRLQENHELCSAIEGLHKQLSAVMAQAKELYDRNKGLEHELSLCRKAAEIRNHKLDLAVVGLKNARSALDELLPWDAEAIQDIGEILFKLTGVEEA